MTNISEDLPIIKWLSQIDPSNIQERVAYINSVVGSNPGVSNNDEMSVEMIVALVLVSAPSAEDLAKELCTVLRNKEYAKIPKYSPWIRALDQGLDNLPTHSTGSWQFLQLSKDGQPPDVTNGSYTITASKAFKPDRKTIIETPTALNIYIGSGKNIALLGAKTNADIIHPRNVELQVLYRFPKSFLTACGYPNLSASVISPQHGLESNYIGELSTSVSPHLEWLFSDFNKNYQTQYLQSSNSSKTTIPLEAMLSEWLISPPHCKAPDHDVLITSPRGYGKSTMGHKAVEWGFKNNIAVVYCDLSLYVAKKDTDTPLRMEVRPILEECLRLQNPQPRNPTTTLFVFDNMDEYERPHTGMVGAFKDLARGLVELQGYKLGTYRMMCLKVKEYVAFSEPNPAGCRSYSLCPLSNTQAEALVKSQGTSSTRTKELLTAAKGNPSLLVMGSRIVDAMSSDTVIDEDSILQNYCEQPALMKSIEELMQCSLKGISPTALFVVPPENEFPLLKVEANLSTDIYSIDRNVVACVFATKGKKMMTELLTPVKEGLNPNTTIVADVLKYYLRMPQSAGSESDFISSHPTIGTDCDRMGRTIIHYSAMRGYCHVIQYLLLHCQEALNFTQTDKHGHTALSLAVLNNNVDCVKHLSGVKCCINPPSFNQPLSGGMNTSQLWAVHGNEEIFDIIVQPQLKKFPTSIWNNATSGCQLISVAAACGVETNMIKKLVEVLMLSTHTPAELLTEDRRRTVAQAAVRGGHTHILDYVISVSPDLVTTPDFRGRTIWHFAAICGEYQLFEWYAKFLGNHTGHSLETLGLLDDDGCTPLHYCCLAGFSAYKSLLDCFRNNFKDPNIYISYLLDTRDEAGRLPLHYCCQYGDRLTVEAILKERPDQLTSVTTLHRQTPLMFTAKGENIDVYDALMEVGSKQLDASQIKLALNAKDYRKQSAFHIAASTASERSRIAEELMKLPQCLLRTHDEISKTALTTAASKGKFELVKSLISKESSALDIIREDCFGLTILHHTCGAGNTSILKYLLSLENVKKLMTSKTKSGQTPWHLAAIGGNKSTIAALSGQKGMAIVDNLQRTPLHCALICHNSAACIELLTMGSDPNARDFNGESCLLYLAGWCHSEVLEKFSEAKTNFNSTDNCKRTAVHFAALTHDRAFIRKLLTFCKVSADTRDKWGMTPLHYAASVLDKLTCSLLIRNVPEWLSAKDNKGLTPMHYAMIAPNPYIVRGSWEQYTTALPNHIVY